MHHQLFVILGYISKFHHNTMTDSLNPPLSYEASATTTHPLVATTLPSEVIACLKNSRFVCCSSPLPVIAFSSLNND